MGNISIIFGIVTLCVGCDQGTKYAAKYYLQNRDPLSYMGDMFRLHYAENTGGFLSMGAGLPDTVRVMLFVVVTTLLLIGFLFLLLRKKKLTVVLATSSALVIGGGLGNILDRITNQGAVIDFMNIGFGTFRTGIFNVADMAIMVGVCMLLYFSVTTADTITAGADLNNHHH